MIEVSTKQVPDLILEVKDVLRPNDNVILIRALLPRGNLFVAIAYDFPKQ